MGGGDDDKVGGMKGVWVGEVGVGEVGGGVVVRMRIVTRMKYEERKR